MDNVLSLGCCKEKFLDDSGNSLVRFFPHLVARARGSRAGQRVSGDWAPSGWREPGSKMANAASTITPVLYPRQAARKGEGTGGMSRVDLLIFKVEHL